IKSQVNNGPDDRCRKGRSERQDGNRTQADDADLHAGSDARVVSSLSDLAPDERRRGSGNPINKSLAEATYGDSVTSAGYGSVEDDFSIGRINARSGNGTVRPDTSLAKAHDVRLQVCPTVIELANHISLLVAIGGNAVPAIEHRSGAGIGYSAGRAAEARYRQGTGS